MKDHGLMFSAEMIQAFLEGRKSMTRRTQGLEKLNQNPGEWGLRAQVVRGFWVFRNKKTKEDLVVKCPYAVGGRIYVKETWASASYYDELLPSELPKNAPIHYAHSERTEGFPVSRKRSSVFMPKWVARIWREIVGIRCERLQDITDEDARAEGAVLAVEIEKSGKEQHGYRIGFKYLWDSLNGKKHPWSKNDWCWVLSLKEVEEISIEEKAEC